MTLVERLNNLIETSEVACERDLYKECVHTIDALERSAKNWRQAGEVITKNLRVHIEAMEKALREIEKILAPIQRLSTMVGKAHSIARAALGEGEADDPQ